MQKYIYLKTLCKNKSIKQRYHSGFKNKTDMAQIGHLAKQIRLCKTQAFTEDFKHAVAGPFSYMVIDCSLHSASRF